MNAGASFTLPPNVHLVSPEEQQRLLDRIRAVRESRPEDAWQAKSLRTTTSDSLHLTRTETEK